MSPEQVRGEKATAAADIFSFGVILYELLTGDLPYKADTAASRILMRLTKKPAPPRQLRREIPKYLEAIVLKCLEVDPALRYPTTDAIIQDLDRHHVDRGLTVRMTRAVSRRRAPLVAMAALGLALLGGAWYWTRMRTPAPTAPEGPVHTVAILPITNAAGTAGLEWLRSGLPEMLVTDLAQSRYVRPVPSERVSRVLRQLGIAEQTRFDEAALESVSKLVPADSVLYGQLVESGGKLRLDLSLRKAGSGVPLPIKAEGSTEDVFALVDSLTATVKQSLDLTPGQIGADDDRSIREVSTGSLDALRAYQAGLTDLQKGANQTAIAHLKEATTKDPAFAMAFARLAEASLNAGEQHEAEAAVERANTIALKAPLPLLDRYRIHATAALVKEDYETAVTSYGEMAKLYPRDPDVQVGLAQALREVGKLPEAIETYRRVLELAPGHKVALLNIGRVQIAAGQNQEALTSAQRALDSGLFQGDPEALGTVHSVMGVAYREMGQLDLALQNLNRSLDLRKQAGDKRGQAVTLNNLAQVYDLQGQPEKALEQQRKVLAIAREMGDRERESNALVEIGLVYKVWGKLDLALASFRDSLQIEMGRQDHANLANRLNHVADVYRLKGQYDDALVYLEQARSHLEKSEDSAERANNLASIGLIKKAQGHYDEAIASYLEAVRLFGQGEQQMGVGNVHQYLAEVYGAQGRYGDALKSLQQSASIYDTLKVEHGREEIKAPLGKLYTAIGRLDEAEKLLGEPAAKAGGHEHGGHGDDQAAERLLARAALFQLRGRKDEAAQAYEQANVAANLSGQKETAVLSRVELSRLYLERGDLDAAYRLVQRTREEARVARLAPLEAEAAAAQAAVLLARGEAEPARRAALEALSLADRYSGRPLLYRTNGVLGDALAKLGRPQDALEAYAKAASILDWIRGSLPPEDVASFVGRPDVKAFARRTLALLDKGGRPEAEPLRKWAGGASS
jgi:tetratricopeptide (TPR) repeat protein